MKITIEDFLERNKNVIRRGWVAFDNSWSWFSNKPEFYNTWNRFGWHCDGFASKLSRKGCDPFDILPFKGRPKDSLIHVTKAYFRKRELK